MAATTRRVALLSGLLVSGTVLAVMSQQGSTKTETAPGGGSADSASSGASAPASAAAAVAAAAAQVAKQKNQIGDRSKP